LICHIIYIDDSLIYYTYMKTLLEMIPLSSEAVQALGGVVRVNDGASASLERGIICL